MTITAPMIVAALTGSAVLAFFFALWLLLQRRDPVEQRLQNYSKEMGIPLGEPAGETGRRYIRPRFQRFLEGFGLGPRLAVSLAQADVPMTATEFTLLIVLLAVLGFVLGTWRFSPILGLALALVLGAIPLVVVDYLRQRRKRAFERQLVDMLTLLVGGLRAGFGLNQALDLLVQRLGPPASVEITNVLRAVNLGVSIRRALEDATHRIGSDDFSLIVLAITVQYETGGNLAETLEIIADTVRSRLHILSEIRVLTSQQRFTGFVLAIIPTLTGLALFLINPEYMGRLFAPGWIRLVPIAAVVWQIIGFILIQRIVDIEV